MSDPKTVSLLYGKPGIALSVPAGATLLRAPHGTSLPDPTAALRQALVEPIGSASLARLLEQKKPRTAAIAISDITRPVPNKLILPALLETLNAHGVRDAQITIIIGTGLHRSSTPAERIELVGPEILARCPVVDHRADDPNTLTKIADDPPVWLNALFMQADFRIVTGLIEPHFMAGFSGGRKGVCPALVDLQTLQRFHGYSIMADPRSTNGVLESNPCHAEGLRIARLVGVDFLVNVTIDRQRQISGVFAGHMEQAHLAGTQAAARACSAAVEKPFDLVVTCGGGYPLDQTFYQAVKGMVAALPACHAGTILLIAADCREGIGSTPYAELMLSYAGNWRKFLTDIANSPQVKKDQWQGQMQCRVLSLIGQKNLILAADGLPAEAARQLWVTPANGAGTAAERCQNVIDEFTRAHPSPRIAVIPEGPYTMLEVVARHPTNPGNTA